MGTKREGQEFHFEQAKVAPEPPIPLIYLTSYLTRPQHPLTDAFLTINGCDLHNLLLQMDVQHPFMDVFGQEWLLERVAGIEPA